MSRAVVLGLVATWSADVAALVGARPSPRVLRSRRRLGLGPLGLLFSSPATARALGSPETDTANMLFLDHQAAMARTAESQRALLEPRATPLEAPDLAAVRARAAAAKNKVKKVKRGTGFGGGAGPKGAKAAALSEAEEATLGRALVLAEEGVLLVPGAVSPETAALLRDCVVEEVAASRRACETDPSRSMSRFHAAQEQRDRSFLLTSLRGTEANDDDDDEKTQADPRMIRGLRELFGPGAALGDLFSEVCGPSAPLYDVNALRTEPGSARQPIHWDTPFQPEPPLFTAFVALQDVTLPMGPTMFIPGTHRATAPERRAFDSRDDHLRDAMLATCDSKYALLKAGDVSIFDMRLLHAGNANRPDEGSTRYFLNFTFRNPKASNLNLGHQPCIRAGYKNKFTLESFRAELASEDPFNSVGDGLLP